MQFLKSLLFLATKLCTFFEYGFSADIIVNNTYNPNWNSLLFIIPVRTPFDEYPWLICSRFSRYYCLHSFEVKHNIQRLAYHYRLNISAKNYEQIFSKIQTMKIFAHKETFELFAPIFDRHNYFLDHNGCCLGQFSKYFIFGFTQLIFTPADYKKKLTDYSVRKKKLNEIRAYYFEECDLNIITQVGFGRGKLRRSSHGTAVMKPLKDVNYFLKVGPSWIIIPYHNPGRFLTFPWFKKNVMCQEQPWICEESA